MTCWSGNSTIDGVRCVELFYRPIKIPTAAGSRFAVANRLNSPAMGTLMPADYLVCGSSFPTDVLFKLAPFSFCRLWASFTKVD